MKTFLVTIVCIVFAGSFLSSVEVTNEQKKFEAQEKRVDSMIVQVNKIDAQLTQINK